MFLGGSLWTQSLCAMQVSRSSATDFSDAGISPSVLHSPPVVFYKAADCLGLI